jgi:hypothetical protein
VEPYKKRILDDELDALLPSLAAISIDGPKGVGKTATASERAATVMRLDDPAVAELVRASPQQLELATKPLLLDEWQRLPEVWDLVRRSVDANSTGGQFLLTGSATPSNTPIHSGAGRIVSLRMRPLSLAERQLDTPVISLAAMFKGNASTTGTTAVASTCQASPTGQLHYPGYREGIRRTGRPGTTTRDAAQLDVCLRRGNGIHGQLHDNPSGRDTGAA